MREMEELAGALAKRLASQGVSDTALSNLVREVTPIGRPPIDVDICTYGICLDYYVDRDGLTELLDKLRSNPLLGPMRIFPKGIILPEGFLVQVEHVLDREG